MEIGKLSLYINGKLEGSNQDTTTGNTKINVNFSNYFQHGYRNPKLFVE
jgi:hypothetical protein